MTTMLLWKSNGVFGVFRKLQTSCHLYFVKSKRSDNFYCHVLNQSILDIPASQILKNMILEPSTRSQVLPKYYSRAGYPEVPDLRIFLEPQAKDMMTSEIFENEF